MSVFLNVCDAISYAHSRGIIHRDLKPQNVVLGDYGEAIVLDWGLARRVNATDEDTFPVELTEDAHTDATQAGQKLGTPAYMSPEQASGRVDLIDHRTDIYGLGAILFQILTGEPPHRAVANAASIGADAGRSGKTSSIAALLHIIATGETPHVCDLDNPLPDELDAICAKAMSKSRDTRYQSAKELKSALLEFQVHKESIELTAIATHHLTRAKQSERYQDYNRALFGFEEALRQWPGNPDAKAGIEQTLIAHGQTAIKHGDIDPRMSLLTTNDDILSEVQTKLAGAHKELEVRRQIMKVFKVAAGVLVAAVMVLLVTSTKFQLDFREAMKLKNRAVEETAKAKQDTEKAEADLRVAEAAKKQADLLRVAADKLKVEAVRASAEATSAKEIAKKEAADALIAKGEAIVAKDVAEVAKKQAVVAKEEAEKLTVASDMKRIEADKKAAEAKLAEEKAAENERKAAYKAGLADASRVIYEGNYEGARERLDQLKQKFGKLCGPEWDLLKRTASAPQAVSMSKPVESISLSHDGRKLVAGDIIGHIVVWSINAGGKILDDQPIRDLQLGTRLRAVAMAPAGDAIASAGEDGLIRVWSLVANAEQPPLVLKGHRKAVNTLKFSSDGKQLAFGSDDHTLRLWSLDSATTIAGTRTSFPVTCLDWSHDGAILVATTRGVNPHDDSTELFKSYKLVAVPKDSPPIAAVPIAQDDQLIAEDDGEPPGFARAYSWRVVTTDDKVSLKILRKYDGPLGRDWAERALALKRLRMHDAPTMSISEGLSKLVYAGLTDDKWDSDLHRVLHDPPIAKKRWQQWEPKTIALTADGRYAVCNGLDSEICLWQTIVGNRIGNSLPFAIGREGIQELEFDHSDDGVITLGSHDNRIAPVRSLAFTPDDSRLLVAGEDGTISIWDHRDGEKLPTYNRRDYTIYGHGGSIHGCLPLPQSPDLIVSGSYDKHIHVLDLKTYLETRMSLESPRKESGP